jgi:hypothetical protein
MDENAASAKYAGAVSRGERAERAILEAIAGMDGMGMGIPFWPGSARAVCGLRGFAPEFHQLALLNIRE